MVVTIPEGISPLRMWFDIVLNCSEYHGEVLQSMVALNRHFADRATDSTDNVVPMDSYRKEKKEGGRKDSTSEQVAAG